MDTSMRRFHTLLRGLRAVIHALAHRPPPGPLPTDPGDLGTAFGLDAALESDRPGVAPLTH